MVQKGMTMALKVVVVIVVILVVAFMVLTVFSGGIGKAGDQINKWFGWINDQKPLDSAAGILDTAGGSTTCQGICVADVASCNSGKRGEGTCPTPSLPYCCA